jgi:hypothetical protein
MKQNKQIQKLSVKNTRQQICKHIKGIFFKVVEKEERRKGKERLSTQSINTFYKYNPYI